MVGNLRLKTSQFQDLQKCHYFKIIIITTITIIIDLVADDHPLAVVGDLLVVGGGAVPAAGTGADGAAGARVWQVFLIGGRGAKWSEGGSIRGIRK